MELNNEKITAEEIEEMIEMEAVMNEEEAEFHQEVLEWLTIDQVLYKHHDITFDEVEREEAYAHRKNIVHEYLLER